MSPDFRRPRAAVTLIELMIVMLIISILAALVLGVAAVAGETARQAQTRHVVERMHTLLIEYYDTYKTRRVKLRSAIDTGISSKFNKPAQRGIASALARLYALRELMMMEIPDRWSDVLLTAVPTNPASGITNGVVSYALCPYYEDNQGLSTTLRTPLANLYLRRYAQIATGTNSITGLANTRDDIIANQGAECLYMIVTLACGDGEARTLFAEKDIGDTDGDGAPEFLDGWGHPISFLRWAPGFDSQIQINANDYKTTNPSTDWLKAAVGDHDPYDLFRMDSAAFRLVPLVISPGRDESLGIYSADNFVRLTGLLPGQAKDTTTGVDPALWMNSTKLMIRPWAAVSDQLPNGTAVTAFLGTSLNVLAPKEYDETATDDVHNHLMGQR